MDLQGISRLSLYSLLSYLLFPFRGSLNIYFLFPVSFTFSYSSVKLSFICSYAFSFPSSCQSLHEKFAEFCGINYQQATVIGSDSSVVAPSEFSSIK